MIYIEQLYPVAGLAIRDTDAHVSGPVSFAESGYSNGLIVLKNSLDQNVTVTVHGRGQWANSWQTIGSVAVATASSGSISVTSPWGEVRISSVAAGIPSSGVLIAEIDMAVGGSGAVTLTTGDLEIGAVEIKDATTATRATVDADGLEVHIDKALPDIDPVIATPTAYNVTLTVADTQYSQAMPANCRGFEFQCRTEHDMRFAFVTGKVAGPAAPYLTLKAGDYYCSFPINQAASPSTLYLASSTAGVVVEVISWV